MWSGVFSPGFGLDKIIHLLVHSFFFGLCQNRWRKKVSKAEIVTCAFAQILQDKHSMIGCCRQLKTKAFSWDTQCCRLPTLRWSDFWFLSNINVGRRLAYFSPGVESINSVAPPLRCLESNSIFCVCFWMSSRYSVQAKSLQNIKHF